MSPTDGVLVVKAALASVGCCSKCLAEWGAPAAQERGRSPAGIIHARSTNAAADQNAIEVMVPDKLIGPKRSDAIRSDGGS